MDARFINAAAFAAALLGATAAFVLTTVAMDTLPDAAIVGGGALVAFALAVAGGGWRTLAGVRTQGHASIGLALAGGALAFSAAPLLALTQRASDAPSGADTLFFTSTLWGVLVVLGAYFIAAERPALTGIAGAVCSAAGTAGLLASWEYPSSFSPFAKFPQREALMLVAGVLFAVGILALAEAVRRSSARDALVLGLGGAAVLGVLASLPALPAVRAAGGSALLTCVYLGLAVVAFSAGWIGTASRVGVARATTSLLLVPVAMTALAFYERATAVYGPSPFELRGVLAGAVVTVAGGAVVWLAAAGPRLPRIIPARAVAVALWVAVASLVLAVLSLATPALAAVSEGHMTESFRVAWTMLGFESAAGWMPFAAALLALTAVLEARRGEAARTWLVALAAVFACALAMPFLSATTLHTWNRWIPAEVQQTYGTEYARLSVSAIIDPVRVGAMALAVVSAGVLGFSAMRSTNNQGSREVGS